MLSKFTFWTEIEPFAINNLRKVKWLLVCFYNPNIPVYLNVVDKATDFNSKKILQLEILMCKEVI